MATSTFEPRAVQACSACGSVDLHHFDPEFEDEVAAVECRDCGWERQPCADCGRPCYYDEAMLDYRHAETPERGCFLIAPEEA